MENIFVARSELVAQELKKYYRVLGVHPNDPCESVRRAYEDRLSKVDPPQFYYDKRVQAEAEELLQELELAYEKILQSRREKNQLTFPWMGE